MEKVFGIFVFGLILMVIAPIVSAFLGAFAGWCVSLVWEFEILDFMRRVGVDTAGLTLWQTGAAMGFLGGFWKTSVYQKKEK